MRCKPGDKCLVVGGFYPEFLGRVLTVTEPCKVHPESWQTDPPQYVEGWALPASFKDTSLLPLPKDGMEHAPGNAEVTA